MEFDDSNYSNLRQPWNHAERWLIKDHKPYQLLSASENQLPFGPAMELICVNLLQTGNLQGPTATAIASS